jgi:hypothetical protein
VREYLRGLLRDLNDKLNGSQCGKTFGTVVSLSHLGLLAQFYVFAILSLTALEQSQIDLLIFVCGLTVIPVIGAAIFAFRAPLLADSPIATDLETANYLTVTLVLGSSCLVLLGCYVFGQEASTWQRLAWTMTKFVLLAHLLAVGLMICRQPIISLAFTKFLGPLRRRNWQVLSTLISFPVAIVLLFRVEPESANYNMIFAHFFAREFDPLSTQSDLLLSVAGALSLLALSMCLFRAENRLIAIAPRRAVSVQRSALAVTIALSWLFYFDFAFSLNTFHFLTNVSPAVQALHGGTLMVDTFSQYGPGPVWVTLIGFLLLEPSFPAAGVVVQIHNLCFYALFLICLYRMTEHKLPALLLGFISITILLAGWWGGKLNMNSVPSALGLRYLPNILMVAALSALPERRRHSKSTLFAGFLSALWSVETLIGTVGIQLGFLLMLNFKERSPLRGLRDLSGVIVPIVAAVAVTSAVTLSLAGELPRYDIYLQFLTRYNMLSDYWSIAASGLFWAWTPVFVAVFLVLALAWIRIFAPSKEPIALSDHLLFYRYVPMAILTSFTASYYVGRSVNFTLIIALLPFCALLIPALLRFAGIVRRDVWPMRAAVLVPTFVLVWAMSFSALAIFRDTSPYSFVFNEVRREGQFSQRALASSLERSLQKRPVLEKDIGHQYLFDEHGVVRDGIRAIEMFAADYNRVAIFLGLLGPHCVASDVALLYANKGHRWPISYTFSDELLIQLSDLIVATPIDLRDGEIVIVRRDKELLSPMQTSIFAKISATETLCPVSFESQTVDVFRVGMQGTCVE